MMSLHHQKEQTDNDSREFLRDNSTDAIAWPESNYTHPETNIPGRYFTVLIYCGLFVVAAIGNLTVFISLFRSRHRKSRISLMIRHLTIADLVVTFIMIPLEIGWRLTEQWLAGNLACKAFLFLRAFGLYLSSNVLVCVSLDRYFAVLHPLKVNDARRRGKCMLTWAWGISLLCSVPQSIVFHVASPQEDPNFVQCVTFGFFTSDLQQMAYNLFGVIAMYFVPLFVIVIAYTAIMCEISNKSKENSKGESYQSSSGRMRLRRSDISNIERARTRTLRMTITIVVVFVICWTPYVVITLWYTFEPETAKEVPDWLQDTLFMMAVSNSCMNPLVYGSYAINLKRECLKWFCCFKSRSRTDIAHGPRVFASGQGAGIARRLYKCFVGTLKVGSGVTRSTATLHHINNRSPMMGPINQYIGILPRKTIERPTSVGHISFLSEPLTRRGYRRSFHSDPCPCNEGIAGESSHSSEAHVPATIL